MSPVMLYLNESGEQKIGKSNASVFEKQHNNMSLMMWSVGQI